MDEDRPEPPTAAPTPAAQPPRLQFSIRGLLLVTALWGVFFAVARGAELSAVESLLISVLLVGSIVAALLLVVTIGRGLAEPNSSDSRDDEP